MNDEIPVLFKKHDVLSQRVSTLEQQAAVQEDRLVNIARAQEQTTKQLSEWRGEFTTTNHTLMADVRKLSDAVLLMGATHATKGALVDRWIPLFIAAVAVGVAIWAR